MTGARGWVGSACLPGDNSGRPHPFALLLVPHQGHGRGHLRAAGNAALGEEPLDRDQLVRPAAIGTSRRN